MLTYTVECIMGGNSRIDKRGWTEVVLYAVVDWRDREDPYKFVHLESEKCMDWIRLHEAPEFPTDKPTDEPSCPECGGEIIMLCTGEFWWPPLHIDADGNILFSGARDDETFNDDRIQCLDCKLVWQPPAGKVDYA